MEAEKVRTDLQKRRWRIKLFEMKDAVQTNGNMRDETPIEGSYCKRGKDRSEENGAR